MRGLRQPQYRLRVGEVRVFYDVSETTVEVLAIVAKPEATSWLAQFANRGVKEVPLSEIKDDLSRYLREAETQEIVITRHGKPAGILIGFESRRTGSNTVSKTIRDFCAGSNRRATVCKQDAGSGWKTWKRSSPVLS